MTTTTKDRLRIWTAAAVITALTVLLVLTGTPGSEASVQQDPDSTRAGAVALGDITNQHKGKGKNYSIDGVGDVVDYFSFSLTAAREVMVRLREMERNANLFLEDQDGNELASSTEPGTANEAIFHELDPGTYYIRVKAMQRGSNIYKLRYKATEIIPENAAPTGSPTISGTAEVGHTLSADTSTVSDDNGLTNAQFAYQWLRDDAEVPGATGSTYKLTADDEGNAVKVRVAFTDDDGFSETLTSTATDAVTRPENVAATGQPTIVGTVQVGDTLTADTSAISDENGLDNVQFSYQWVRNDGNSDTQIPGATNATYTPTTDDLVHTIKVRVNFTDDNGYAETATSAATSLVNRPPNALPTGKPAITGSPQVDETLSVDASGISDLNGLTNPGFTYQWMHTSGSTDTAIPGATGSTYIVAESDTGKAFKVSVSYTDDHGYAHTVTSDASAPVVNFDFLHNDDCPRDNTTTCTITLGGSFDGNIHNSGDEYEGDWVKLEDLTTGRYRFKLTGHGASPSPSLTMIIRKEGRSPGTVADGTHVHHFVAGSNAGVAGNPTDVYIEVRGENGDYRLSVERLSYIEPSGADLPNDTTTAGWLEVGYDPYPGKSGRVAYSSDGDAFWVDLEAGKSYRIDVRGNETADFGGTAPDTIMSLTMPEATSATLLNPIQDIVSHIAPGGVLSQAMIATGGGQGDNARLDIRVNTSGQFLIEASDSDSTGTYTVVVNELIFNPRGRRATVSETSGSDLPDDGGTLGRVQVNGAGATGNIGSTTDEDAFLVHLEAGRAYQIDVWGNDSTDDGGTLPDPTVDLLTAGAQQLTITDAAVMEQLNPTSSTSQQNFGIFDDDSGEGNNARLLVRVHQGGTYLLLAGSATLTDTGTYTVFVKDGGDTFTANPRGSRQTVSEPNSQDLPNFLTSSGYVQVNGDGATGRIARTPGDQDVFAVKLHRNTQYRIEVWGDDAIQNGGSLADPKVTLRNHAFDKATNGGELEQIGLETWKQASRDGIHDNNSGSGKNAQVDVAPHWSQRTYYIQVGSQDGGTGTYTVYVTEIGKANRLAPTPLVKGLPPVHSYIPTSSEKQGSDLPHDTTTNTWIKPVGTRAHGELEDFADEDYWKAKLVSGYSYRIDMKGNNSAEPGGTLFNPAVWLKDRNGNDIHDTSGIATPTLCDSCIGQPRLADDNSGSGRNARIEVDVKETQTFHIKAGNGSNTPGTYTVQLTILGKHGRTLVPQGTTKTKSEGDADLPDDTTTTGFVRPSGDPATGNIAQNGDIDVFRTRFVQGHRYRIDVNGAESTDQGGTLADPLLTILDSAGNPVSDTDDLSPLNFNLTDNLLGYITDDESGAGNNPKIILHASTTGTYYLQVDEDGDDATGTYTIQVTALEDTGVRFGPQGSQETVSEIPGEDLSDSRTATTGRIQPSGDPATGNISPAGDEDAFTFDLRGNARYRIDVKGSDSSGQGGTLADPEVLLIGPSGVRLTETLGFITLTTGQYTSEGVVDNDSGEGRNARLVFTNTLSGTTTYTIRVREHGGDATGTYTAVITRLE